MPTHKIVIVVLVVANPGCRG